MALFYPHYNEHRSHGIATSLSWRTGRAAVQCRCSRLVSSETWRTVGCIWFIWMYDLVWWCIMMIWWFDDDLMMTWWCMSYIDYHWFSYAIAEHRSQRVTSAQVRAAKSSAFRAKLLGDKCWIEASKPQQLQLCKRITSGLLETTLDHFGPLFFPIYMFIIVYSRETKWVSGQQSKLWDLITFGTMPWHLANLGMLQSCFSQFQLFQLFRLFWFNVVNESRPDPDIFADIGQPRNLMEVLAQRRALQANLCRCHGTIMNLPISSSFFRYVYTLR